MSTVVLNEVRKSFYLDSVALMRLSRAIAAREGIEEAALMMGTPANLQIMTDAGLLADTGAAAGGGDLVIAIRGAAEAADDALAHAIAELEAPSKRGGEGEAWQPSTIRSAVKLAPAANLALISVPGAFAAAEARKAIRRGLHAMIFSDNVSIEDEAELKQEARDLGGLVMGPDCGTAIIAGTPLAFANAVPRGPIGIVGASGTGIQEVSCLIAQGGGGISHAIGVGGRDLKSEVGGITTLMAIDALTRDSATEQIVIVAKPPGEDVASLVLDRLAACGKPAIVCFMGAAPMQMPANATQVFTLAAAASIALGQHRAEAAAPDVAARAGALLGLYAGGTLSAEAQVIFRDAGLGVTSNAPVDGIADGRSGECVILDLGDDEFTQGRPHPMIDPGVRDVPLIDALGRDDLGAILVDVVIGYGAHDDPAGQLADTVNAHTRPDGPLVICAVTGTDADPQVRSAQMAKLEEAGIIVAPCNADAARWALALTGRT